MAKAGFNRWQAGLALALALLGVAQAAEPVAAPAEARWARAPRLYGRITASELGLVINTADPYSISVAGY